MAPYPENGTLTTDKRTVDDTTTWDAQSDWEAYQSAENVEIVNGAVQLEEITLPASTVLLYDGQADSRSPQEITTIPDQEGSRDATGTGAIVSDGVGGFKSYQTDSADGDSFSVSFSTTVSQPFTVVMAIEPLSFLSDNLDVIASGDTNRAEIVATAGSNNDSYHMYAGGNTLVGGTNTTDSQILAAVFDGADSLLRKNQTNLASGDAGSTGLDGVTLSYGPGSFSEYFDGKHGEYLLCDADLRDTGELAEQEQRMADKWGITL